MKSCISAVKEADNYMTGAGDEESAIYYKGLALKALRTCAEQGNIDTDNLVKLMQNACDSATNKRTDRIGSSYLAASKVVALSL